MGKITILLLIFFLFPQINASEKEIPIKLEKEDNTKNDRPRAPQRHSTVECYYRDGVITIEFETAEGDATFTVTDVVTGDKASTMFNTAMEFNYFIGSEPSTYLLEISTYEGNNYEGYLTID